MIKKDYDALSEKQLRFFPLEEFWNPKKSDWASGDAGRYAKQQSAKLKRIFGAEKFV